MHILRAVTVSGIPAQRRRSEAVLQSAIARRTHPLSHHIKILHHIHRLEKPELLQQFIRVRAWHGPCMQGDLIIVQVAESLSLLMFQHVENQVRGLDDMRDMQAPQNVPTVIDFDFTTRTDHPA